MKKEMSFPNKIDTINYIKSTGISCDLKINGQWIGSVCIDDIEGITIKLRRIDNGYPLTVTLYQISDIRHC